MEELIQKSKMDKGIIYWHNVTKNLLNYKFQDIKEFVKNCDNEDTIKISYEYDGKIMDLEKGLLASSIFNKAYKEFHNKPFKKTQYCICRSECLGCSHKDAICKELRGYN